MSVVTLFYQWKTTTINIWFAFNTNSRTSILASQNTKCSFFRKFCSISFLIFIVLELDLQYLIGFHLVT